MRHGSFFTECQRCGGATYERFRTHSLCVHCCYSPDEEARFAGVGKDNPAMRRIEAEVEAGMKIVRAILCRGSC